MEKHKTLHAADTLITAYYVADSIQAYFTY